MGVAILLAPAWLSLSSRPLASLRMSPANERQFLDAPGLREVERQASALASLLCPLCGGGVNAEHETLPCSMGMAGDERLQ
mmetsp:Transcript_8754/g.16620  ORF Transcript_8754/g.16620 Transcript_8754/m.16620 type:complete len:81 (+) Transcript_8754:2348-2590(+)